MPDDAVPLDAPGAPDDAIPLPPEELRAGNIQPQWKPPIATGQFPEPAMKGGPPTLAGVPPGLGGQALVAGEEFVMKPAAITAGTALGAASPIPGGAALGGAAFGVGSEAAIETLNRALGFKPVPLTGLRLPLAAAGGAAPAVLETVGGAVGKRILGLTAREKAMAKVRDVAATAIPGMQDEVRLAEQRRVGALLRAGTAHERAVEREVKRVKGEAKSALSAEEESTRRGLLGTTAQEVSQRRAQQGLSPDYGVAYNEATVGTIRDVQRAGQAKFAQAYQNLYEPFVKEPLDDELKTAMSEGAQEMLADTESFQSIPSKLRQLVERVRGGVSPEESEAIRAKIVGDATRGVPLDKFPPAARAEIDKSIEGQVAEAIQKASKSKGPKTVGDLLQIQADAAQFMNNPNGPTRHVASELRSRMLDALDASGVARDPELNARYRLWRKTWDWPTLRQIHTALGPADLNKMFEPEVFASLVANANPTQKEMLKATLADWAVANKKSLSDIAGIVPANTARELGLPDISHWQEFDARAAADVYALQQRPELRQALQGGMQTAEKLAFDKFGMSVKKSTQKMLNAMGDYAKPLRNLVATMEPREAVEFYDTVVRHPEFLNQLLADAAKFETEQPRGVWRLFKHHAPYLGMVGAGELMTRGALSAYVAGATPMVFGAEILNQLRTMGLRSLSRRGMLAKLEARLAASPTPSRARQIGKLIGHFALAEAVRYPAAKGKMQTVQMEPTPVPLTGLPDITPPPFPTPTP